MRQAICITAKRLKKLSPAASIRRSGCLFLACLLFQQITPISVLGAETIDCPRSFPAHPRLFVNTDEIEALKAFVEKTPSLNHFVTALIERCDDRLSDIPTPPSRIENLENRAISMLARDFSIAYLFTDQKKYANAAATILLSYTRIYPEYEITVTKGKAAPSTLNEARWIIDLATAYDLIYNSGTLSDREKENIEANVFIPCGEVLRICNHKTRSNWRARAIAGLGVIGFCIGNCDFINEALNGYQDENGNIIRNGFVQHLGYSVLGDGIFYERSFGYQAYTSDSYFLLMEAARHSGVDLWNVKAPADNRDSGADVERRFGAAGIKDVKPMFDALFYRTFSDGSVSNVANASADHFLRRRYYEAAWRAWRDPKYAYAARISSTDSRPWEKTSKSKANRVTDAADLLWIEPSLPDGSFSLEPDTRIGNSGIHKNGCTLFPNGGYAILRTSTDPSAVCAEMNFGCWGSGHSHPDKLSIVVSDGNKKVVREVKYFGYADDKYLTWDRQTIAHNTVTVDQTSQAPQGDTDNAWAVPNPGTIVRGRPIFFYPGKRLKAFRAECTDAYPGVRLERTIAIVDSIVFDFFVIDSATQHEYDYALHIDAPLMTTRNKMKPTSMSPLSQHFGYRHIEISEVGKAPLTAYLGYGRKIQFLTPSHAMLGSGVSGKGHAGRSVVVLRTEGTQSIYVSAFQFKPQNVQVSLGQYSSAQQTILIGDNLKLINTGPNIGLYDTNGRLLEIAR